MSNIKRSSSGNLDFRALATELDIDLAIRDGNEHAFYAQFNKIALIKNAVVCYLNGTAVGCGAFKKYNKTAVEIKRMFVKPDFRGKGIATAILKELEQWAAEKKYTECVLETGKKQPEAIGLYIKAGYRLIPNYGQYVSVENSVCMMKVLK